MSSEKGRLFGRTFKAKVINLSTGATTEIVDLRMAFKLTKTNKAKGNRGTIEIYNLSPLVRGVVLARNTNTGKPQVQIDFSIGYGKETKLFFRGIGTVSTEWNPPDYISKFVITDGSAQTSQPLTKTYDKGFPVDDIIADFLGAIGLPIGNLETLGVALKESRSFSGKAEDNLSSLSSTYGFVFDIQHGIASIYLKGSKVTRTLIKLNKSSGLIGIPYWEGSIVKARTLLIPEITPNSIVDLDVPNVDIKGSYEIAKVSGKGDNWGSQGDLEVELIPRQLLAQFDNLVGLEGIIA